MVNGMARNDLPLPKKPRLVISGKNVKQDAREKEDEEELSALKRKEAGRPQSYHAKKKDETASSKKAQKAGNSEKKSNQSERNCIQIAHGPSQIEATESNIFDPGMTVVTSPSELAAVTDPFELQRMGYEFMVAATAKLQKERDLAFDERMTLRTGIEKLEKELQTADKRALMEKNIYDNVVKGLKEQNEKLEEKIKYEIERYEMKIKEILNENKKKLTEEFKVQEQLQAKIGQKAEEMERAQTEALKKQGCLEEKIKTLMAENDRLAKQNVDLNAMFTDQNMRVTAIPEAIRFFLTSYLGRKSLDKMKKEPNSTGEGKEEEEQMTNNENGNLFENIANQR